jgi:uroporphyrinogen-III synthase
MRRVIVLRPEPGASETVARARQLGLDAIAVPLFRIEPLDWAAPDPTDFDALLLTSTNAVRQGGAQLQGLQGLPVYAVGGATAGAARRAGFTVVQAGSGGIEELLAEMPGELRLLHLCGEDRKTTSPNRHAIMQIAVYRAKPIDSPPLAAIQGALALIHSPRAGRRFAELVRRRSSIRVAALSPAAAQAAGPGWEAIEAADQPTDEALLALAARLCNKPQP